MNDTNNNLEEIENPPETPQDQPKKPGRLGLAKKIMLVSLAAVILVAVYAPELKQAFGLISVETESAQQEVSQTLEVAEPDSKPLPVPEFPQPPETLKSTYLPVSLVEATLLNAVRANGSDRELLVPKPLFLEVEPAAVLPGQIRSVQACIVVAEASADLTTERVELGIRLISCRNAAGQTVIESKLEGTVYDEDGIMGVAASKVVVMATRSETAKTYLELAPGKKVKIGITKGASLMVSTNPFERSMQ